jgi:hypothetical protein
VETIPSSAAIDPATLPAPGFSTSPRLLRVADWFADLAGFMRAPPMADALIETAQRNTGLDDFGEWQFAKPLRMLLNACESEADLGIFGRFAVRWDALRFLENMLRLREAEKRASHRVAIEQPIFVTGLPRSGTTFLYNLLMEDDVNAAPRCWQTIYPGVAGDPKRARRAIRSVDRQLRVFRQLAPDFDSMHPFKATTPQECSEITAHVFASLRFDTTYHIPSYRAWLDVVGHHEAYRFHRYFLEHLACHEAPGRRWILKCPEHVFALDAIRKVYPDARFVFVHRDPMRVLASVARLTEVLRQPFARRVDRASIGRQVCDHWADGAMRILEAGATIPADRVVHIRYRDLIGDPVATVAQLYAQFGLPCDDGLKSRIAAYVAAKPNGGYGQAQARYRLQDYGIDAAQERRRFGDYVASFDVAPEPARQAGTVMEQAA